ncbi:thiopeptide-type bacteriocin biosynthesis protein [Hamadaea sp. NPDC051192]|uniref:thiopeptide-type bacteriocin biosynthesis protein n=1 Tax=Hamadaea sp. NPDC051192 TaxID=3154940 RepID=UPI0034401F01
MSTLRPRRALTAIAVGGREVRRWFLMRKRPVKVHVQADEPSWFVAAMLNQLTADGVISGWTPDVYELETAAFGGPVAMTAAHELFCVDTTHVLRHLAQAGCRRLGRTEAHLLLCGVLLRAAGLDQFEQANVGDKVHKLRGYAAEGLPTAPDRLAAQAAKVALLLATDPRPLCRASQPFPGYARWVAAYETTGQTLAYRADHGWLRRGLRDVLAHHLIFTAKPARHRLARSRRGDQAGVEQCVRRPGLSTIHQ